MALGAAERQAEPDGGGRVGAIDGCLDAKLLLVHAAFVVRQRVAVKAGGRALFQRGVRQQVAGKLLDGEAVERQVLVQRVDDPVAPAPGVRPAGVFLVAVGVGIAGRVEPVPGPALPIVRRAQQPIDQLLVGVGGTVVQEFVDLYRRRRQAEQVEAEPSQQRRLVRFGRRSDSFVFQTGEDEAVNVVVNPARLLSILGVFQQRQ